MGVFRQRSPRSGPTRVYICMCSSTGHDENEAMFGAAFCHVAASSSPAKQQVRSTGEHVGDWHLGVESFLTSGRQKYVYPLSLHFSPI